MGWHVPTREQLASLIDPPQNCLSLSGGECFEGGASPVPMLPPGHPFENIVTPSFRY